MQPDLTFTPGRTVHERYRELLRAGFAAHESAALIALADGIGGHPEGESPTIGTWRWQEITGIKFIAYLASDGRLGGPDDGGSSQADRLGHHR